MGVGLELKERRVSNIIILNAPIGAGKDTIADLIVQQYGYVKLQFKDALFQCMSSHFNVPIEVVQDLNHREHKEKPNVLYNGMTPREAAIHVSECIIKPKYGNRYFGEYLSRVAHQYSHVVVSDSGFHEEVQAVQDEHSTAVVRLMGRGTFIGDSRNYLNREHLKAGTVYDVKLQEGKPELAVQEIMQLQFK